MTPNNLVTIQLTVPALEKLFENDPTFVLNLRSSVVSEFARRKIDSMISSGVTKEVDAEIKKRFGSIDYRNQVIIKKEYSETIKSLALKIVDEYESQLLSTIKETVRSSMSDIQKSIEKEVQHRVNYEMVELVKAKIRDKMNETIKSLGA